jgi:hypothetical protein
MPSLLTLASWGGLILLGGFFAIVFWKLATGSIVLDQLLEGDVRDPESADGYSTQVSPARVQSLSITLFVALYYLVQVIQNCKELPALPGALVALLAGSHAVYLGGKAQAMLGDRLRGLWR